METETKKNMRLINGDKWLEDVRKVADSIQAPNDYVHLSCVEQVLNNAPEVDAVPASFIEKWKEGKTGVEKLIADKILMDWKVEQWTEEERNGIYRR